MSKTDFNFASVTGELPIDDLWFEKEESAVVKDPAEPIVTDPIEPKEEEEIIDPENKEFSFSNEKDLTQEELTIDDITFGEESNVETVATDSTVMLDAYRSILLTKMERYNIDSTKFDLAEMDEATLADLEESLDGHILNSKYSSLKSIDPNIEKILTYLENEGDPKAFIKLFKDQEAVDNIDTSSEEGKVRKISAYYKDVLGWNDDKVSKRVERIRLSNSINEEFEDINEEFSAHFEAKREELVAQKEKETKQKQKVEESRKAAFAAKLGEKAVSDDIKKKIFNTAFGQGKYESGESISLLNHKILQMQADPEKYIKLAQFLTDPEMYDTMIRQEKTNIQTTETLKRGFQTVPNRKQSETVKSSTGRNSNSDFVFNKK